MDGYQHDAEAGAAPLDGDVDRLAGTPTSSRDGGPRPITSAWLLLWLLAALLAWLLPWSASLARPSAVIAGLDACRRLLLLGLPAPALPWLSLALLVAALALVVGFNLAVSTFDTSPGRLCVLIRAVRRRRLGILIMVSLLACLSGTLWTLGQVDGFRQHALHLNQRLDLTVTGRVVGLPRMYEDHLRFALRVARSKWRGFDRAGSPLAPGSLILLNRYGYPHGRDQWIGAGRVYRMVVRLKPPHGTVNPGGFDYQRWLFRHHYVATGYVHGTIEALPTRSAGWLDRLRADLRGRLVRQAHDPQARGLLLGLTLGDRSYLSPEDWSVLLATGTNHLLAISGLHVGMMAGLFALLAGAAWRRTRWCEGLPAQKVAAVAALSVAWLYAMIAGLSIPTERAAIMLTVMLTGVLFARRWRLFDLWLLAAMVILLIDPFAPLDAGFWLSFLAVLVIIVWIRHRPEAPLWRRLIELQLILTLALWPWVWGLFDRVAWASVPANLLAVPLVSWLITPLSLLSLAAAPVWPSASVLLAQMVGWLGHGLFSALSFLAAQVPDTRLAAPPAIWLVLAMFGVMLLLLPRRWPRRWLGVLLLLPAALYRPASPAVGSASIWLFDLGQGTACLVRTHRHALLYVRGQAAQDRIAGALRTLGIEHLDRIETGHTTARQRRQWRVVVSGNLEHAPVWDNCRATHLWHWDGVRFLAESVAAAGDRSCVLRVRDRYGETLLGDDLDRSTAQALVSKGGVRADWLVVPHRGADGDSPEAFVQAVWPKAALIGAGYLNRYGDPDPATLRRYRRLGARIYVSGVAGALTIRDGRVVGLRSRRWPFAWRRLLSLR